MTGWTYPVLSAREEAVEIMAQAMLRSRAWPVVFSAGAATTLAEVALKALEQAYPPAASPAPDLEGLGEALEPFAAVGSAIDGNDFGKAIFPDEARAFDATWSEDGEARELTWGDFRRAARALSLIFTPEGEGRE